MADPIDETQDAIVAYVREHPEATTDEIAGALGADTSVIARIVNALLSTGIVRGHDGQPWTALDTLKPEPPA